MISFESDYITGAHPKILEKLVSTNSEVLSGYGSDKYCESAREKIRLACGLKDADVRFIAGGTQTNALIISALLRDYAGVIAADTGHVALHEAGAIEYTGHKVLTLPQNDGKIAPKKLRKYLCDFFADENHEHMVLPGMVYISHPTEYGTLYSKAELEEISLICDEYGIPLFMDGARLGYALASRATDLSLEDIARLCHVFYIGGTKLGALCGEAVVFTRNNMPKHFLTTIKQHGALLAKGRLLGVQFDALFTDGLYMEISRHAIRMAELLKEVLTEKKCVFHIESFTNQQFVVFDNDTLSRLKQEVAMSFWERVDADHTVVRLATCWSTTEDDIKALAKLL